MYLSIYIDIDYLANYLALMARGKRSIDQGRVQGDGCFRVM